MASPRTVPSSRLASSFPALQNRGGKAGAKTRMLAVLISAFALLPFELQSLDITAHTESGRSVVLARVEKDVTMVEISCHDMGLTLEDPVVDIRGLAELEDLQELKFYYVPQIISYRFLNACTSLKRLLISFGRVRSIDFLSAMPELIALHIEFSNDWESEHGLPFTTEPIDLSANNTLEYLAFRICGLQRVPVFVKVPGSLRYVDLSYNLPVIGEQDEAALDSLKTVEQVILAGAAGGTFGGRYGNLVFADTGSIYGEYFGE